MSQTTLVNRIRSVFEENRDRVFLIESMTGRSWTFAELHEWGLRGAALLKSHGIGKGDRVALVLANSAEFAAMYFSCLFIGAVAVPVNQALHTDDVSYILQHSGAKLLLFSRCTRSLVLQATEKLNTLKQLRVALGQETSFHPEDVDEAWTFDQGTKDPSIIPLADVSDDDTLLVLFTSGTTGRPKGVVHPVRSEFGNAVAFNEAMQFGPEHRFLHIWPMAYSSGYLNTLMSPFMAGSSVVLSCAFTAQTILAFWKPVLDHQANTLWLSPTMMASLLRLDRDQAGIDYCRGNVKSVCVGTAPLALKLKKDFETKYGVECMESYGFNTETGEVEKSPTDEWFPTGDIGLMQDDGNIFITGRKKDLIIRGGQNLSPRAVRECLLHHPSVDDAVVVGIPHDFYGEEVAAALKLKPGLVLADEQSSILQHCRKHLAQAAVPTKLKQLDEFPLGSTGKILNREVQRLLAAKS